MQTFHLIQEENILILSEKKTAKLHHQWCKNNLVVNRNSICYEYAELANLDSSNIHSFYSFFRFVLNSKYFKIY